MIQLDVCTLHLKNLTLFDFAVPAPGVFPNLIRLIEVGRVAPMVAQTFPLERIADAQTASMAKRHVEKIVLEVYA